MFSTLVKAEGEILKSRVAKKGYKFKLFERLVAIVRKTVKKLVCTPLPNGTLLLVIKPF